MKKDKIFDDDEDAPDVEEKRIKVVSIGNPSKWSSREQLISLCKKYFKKTPFEELTITGLALSLGTSRRTLLNWEKGEKDIRGEKTKEMAAVITQCKSMIEHSYEIALRKSGKAGDIFGLKNFGWTDVVDVNQNVKGEVNTGINWITAPASAVLPEKDEPLAIDGEIVEEEK